MTDVQEKTNLTREQSDEALQRFTDGFISGLRAPVLHRPSEVGVEYEDVTFPARDGVLLEGWFIPAPGSAKLIIANSQHRKEAAVDREHDSLVGRLHGVPAPPPAHARLVRAVPMI